MSDSEQKARRMGDSEQKAQLVKLERAFSALLQAVAWQESVLFRGLWGRLRWLLTGK